MLNYYSWWVGGWEKTKLMLYSTLVEIEVEVEVKLGKRKGQAGAELRQAQGKL